MLVIRNIITLHGRSSMRLEPTFWTALDRICEAQGNTRSELVQAVERANGTGSLTSSVRSFVLCWFMERNDDGR